MGADTPVTVSRRRLLRTAVATAGITSAGLISSRWVRSPEQLIADQQPPAPTVLTAPVERRRLVDTVVLRGAVGARATFDLTPAPRDNGRPVVTAVRVRPGEEITAGQVLVEVAGRPLVALPGAVPAYRDLRPGAKGEDVRQLQAALASLGVDPRERDGILGPGTKRALAAFYESLGYDAPTEGDAASLNAARDAVRRAERAAADAAELGGPEAGRAREDLSLARMALTETERTTGPMLPVAEVVFLPSLPARVEKLKAVLGAEVAAPLITVSAGDLLVRSRLDPGSRAQVRPGAPAELYSEVLGLRARGTVSAVGDLEVADEERSHALTIEPAEGPLDPRFAGQDVRVVVDAASSAGEVLVVPVTALFAGADGRTAVLRSRAAGDREGERVLVEVGMTGNGHVEVIPAGGAVLRPGDRVVIGKTPSSAVAATGS
jgi:HlyD family secretion protein